MLCKIPIRKTPESSGEKIFNATTRLCRLPSGRCVKSKNNKNKLKKGINMDFDDDSLDDLLRDTSANKFKKPAVNVVADELFSTPNIQSSRKEKKSALLAELFGPSSTSFGAIESSLEEHEKDTEKSMPINSLLVNSTVQGKENEEFSFGSYVPSGATKLTGSKNRPTSSDSPSKQKQTDFFQPSNSSLAQRSVTLDQFGSGGLLKESFNIPTLEKEPATSTLQLKFSVQVPDSKDGAESSSKSHSELPTPTIPPALFSRPISKGTNVTQQIPNEQARVTTDVIPFTFPSPKSQPVSKEILDEKNLTIIKDVLDNFSNNFCKRLENFIGENYNFSDITNCLVELHKSINTVTHTWSSSANKVPDLAFEELERRMLTLENRLELTSQENTNLRVRLEFVENQLRENRNDSSRIKTDTEAVVESHFKWIRETVDNLDKKISTNSSQCKHHAGEESSSRELIFQQMQEKLLDFESKLVKSSTASGHQQEETLHLLKAECKWLERQKKKLNSDRKELRVFQKKIQEKQQSLDEFSAELSKTSHRLQSQCLAVDARVKKIEKLWTSLQEKPEKLSEKDVSKHSFKSSDIQMEDFGLALWKLHVKGDEQKLTEQHNFLQMLNTTVI